MSLSTKAKQFNSSYILVQIESEKKERKEKLSEKKPTKNQITFSSQILKLKTVSKH